MNSSDDLYAPRAVKPRSRRYKKLPVVALDWNPVGNWLHETGEIGPMAELVTDLHKWESTIFTMEGAADWLALVDQHWQIREPNAWQWRVTENERAIHTPGNKKVASRVTAVVHYFGFKGGNTFKLLDPVTMYGKRLDDIWPTEEGGPRESSGLNPDSPQVRLLKWAVALRDFCDENGMEVRPSIGSISSQFWTDRRFYPHPRRKVPRVINDRARENLPGNHYALFTMPTPEQEFTGLYLDQTRAHHFHARTTPMPHADSLYAYGYFQDPLKERPLTTAHYLWDDVPNDFYGLVCVEVALPEQPLTGFDWIKKSGPHFLFTNEIPHLIDSGYLVLGVRAAWGSFARDEGVARYATFAEAQLDRYKGAAWVKPLLLAAYGTLATRAGYGETVFRLARKGEPVQILTGRHTLNGILTKRPCKLEPGIANVIHRGMIEAACRSESIGYAQHLSEWEGRRVLSIYADAVIVEADDDKLLAYIPEPWRLKATLNHLQFISQQAFVSGEMTKLPGVSRDFLKYRQRSPGHAPPRPMHEAVTGRPIKTTRKI